MLKVSNFDHPYTLPKITKFIYQVVIFGSLEF